MPFLNAIYHTCMLPAHTLHTLFGAPCTSAKVSINTAYLLQKVTINDNNLTINDNSLTINNNQ